MEGIRLAGLLFVFLSQMPQAEERIEKGTNAFFADNKLGMIKMGSTSEYQDRRKNWREKDLTDEDLNESRNLRHQGLPKEKALSANDMQLWVTKPKTSRNHKLNIFEHIEGYTETNPDHRQLNQHKRRQQQRSDKSKVRSSRQRRTVEIPETKLVCQEELSCRNRCQNPRTVSYQAQISCFCDKDCEFFQDCCADYDDFCGTTGQNVKNSTTQNTSNVEHLVNQENRDLWRCYGVRNVKGASEAWMIGSCPSSWPENDVLYRCRNLSQTPVMFLENYRYLPVYTSNGRVYHNRFCAQCNGVSSKKLSGEFSLSIECDFTPPRHPSLESTISFLFFYCQEILNYGIYPSPKKGHPRRYCLDHIYLSPRQCFPSSNIDTDKTLAKCLSGKPRLVTSRYFYRNIDCAKCDNQMNPISCGPNITIYKPPWEEYTPPKPFSVIFNFSNDDLNGLNLMQIETPCPSKTVYDHYLDICTDAIPALPNFAGYYEYRVVLWLHPSVWPLPKADAYHPALAQALAFPMKQVRNIEIRKYKIAFTFQIRKNEPLHLNVRNILDFKSEFVITIKRVQHTVFKVNKRILSCADRPKYYRSEYAVLQDGTSAVSIKKTGEVFQSTDYYINTTEPSASANDSQAIFVCRQPQISICLGVYILINEGEFRVLGNKSIFVNASKQVYDRSEYIWQDTRVLVCENFSSTYSKTNVVPNDDPLLTIITLVCMSLSIIGLVFVLVTYSWFSELRTPPEINLMNLSASILLAQLLWILGSGQTDTPMACTVIAVILHYLFLVSFVWTSIIAFDTWRALSSENQPNFKVVCRVVVGWLPALAYVSICVVLDITDTVNIGYKSRMACWMANKWAILYFFAVPVFLCLVFNMVFCVMTFKKIKVTTAQASAATDHNTKNNFGIYVRIASLMGFTWIFGFAAPFGWQFLWYPFVILNGLQGVYIALTFGLNKRALFKRFKVPCASTESSNITVSKTETDDSEYRQNSVDTKL